jgi:hypothetical protein
VIDPTKARYRTRGEDIEALKKNLLELGFIRFPSLEVEGTRPIYSTIVRWKAAQIVLNHPKRLGPQDQCHQLYPLIPEDLAALLGGPEKAE